MKLLPRSAMLSIPVVGRLMESFEGDRESLAFFLGVGREPPDEGDSEACLAASSREGTLDTGLLSTRGIALYPPLLPLRSLPNMALAHPAMLFGLRGPNDAIVGEAGAGFCALIEAAEALRAGQARVALAGAADSRVDLGTARDLYRLGRAGPERAPAEGAVVFRLEDLEPTDPRALGWVRDFERRPSTRVEMRPHWRLIGDLGAADGLLELALAVVRGRGGRLTASDDEGVEASVLYVPAPGASLREVL
jgi:hypothetical protein